jgi:hypothetical protein
VITASSDGSVKVSVGALCTNDENQIHEHLSSWFGLLVRRSYVDAH